MTLTAPGRGCHDVTAEIAAAAKAIGVGSNVRTGWLNVFVQHTSASLAVCDSTIAGAGDRLERALNETVPESWNDEFFVHTYEGPDDMPGHVKASIVGCPSPCPSWTASWVWAKRRVCFCASIATRVGTGATSTARWC